MMFGRHERETGSSRLRSGLSGRDRGDTLIEVLIAVLIISISVAALLDGLITSTTTSATHRSLTTISGLLKSFAETAKYQIQTQASATFNDCATTYSVTPGFTVPPDYSVGISSIEYWNGSGWSTSPPGGCPANGSADGGIELINLLAIA